jgi:hypothetical protein
MRFNLAGWHAIKKWRFSATITRAVGPIVEADIGRT